MAKPSKDGAGVRTPLERYAKGGLVPEPVPPELAERHRSVPAPRSRRAFFVAAGCAVVLAVGALALVVPEWNAQTRVAVGSAVITGLIVGVALVLIERSANRRRMELDRTARELLFGDAARDAFARLVVAHIEMYWSLLSDYRNDAAFLNNAAFLQEAPARKHLRPRAWMRGTRSANSERRDFVGEAPAGFGMGDTHVVWFALAWFIERSSNNVRWWQDTSLLIKGDALVFISTDLLERKGFPLDQGNQWRADADSRFQLVGQRQSWEMSWLSNLTQRLLEHDDAERAFALDSQVRALRFHDVPAYGTEGSTEIITEWQDRSGVIRGIGGSPLRDIRDVVAWLVDRLRDDAVPVNHWGVPTVAVADPVTYRWGPILGGDEAARAWERRFITGSWFRRVLDSANQEWREMLQKELKENSSFPPDSYQQEIRPSMTDDGADM